MQRRGGSWRGRRNVVLLGLSVSLTNYYKNCCPRAFPKMPQNSNVWSPNPPGSFHSSASAGLITTMLLKLKAAFFSNPFEIVWSGYWAKRIVSATACWSWSTQLISYCRYWSAVISSNCHCLVTLCCVAMLWDWEMSKTLSNVCKEKKSSPTVFLMLMFELSLVPLKEFHTLVNLPIYKSLSCN